jgi:cytoskeletal protein CcmA (bactofilin family)
MFGSKEAKKENIINAEVIETIIGLNSEIEGSVLSKGSVRIDGKLNGDVSIEGNLIVGDQGLLKGNVKAKNIMVAGELIGNVAAKEKIEINKSGKLSGDILSKFIVIEDGAQFTGHCKMETEESKTPLLKENNKK